MLLRSQSSFIAGIINTHSRGGRSGRGIRSLCSRFESALQDEYGPVSWLYTDGHKSATALTRQAIHNGAGIILSFGGDGTHSEVVNGFFEAGGAPINPEARLAVVDRGTGGDLRKSLGLDHDIAVLIDSIRNNQVRSMDIGTYSCSDSQGKTLQSFFVNILSAGIGGEVDRRMSGHKAHRLNGTAMYALAALQTIMTYKNGLFQVHIDNEPVFEQKSIGVVVANGRYFGGGMHVAPKACLDDGHLDVVCLGDFSLLDFVTKGRLLYRGEHLALKEVWHYRARTVNITADTTRHVDADGECPGLLPLQVNIIPGALKTYVGPRAAFEGIC